MPRLTRLFSFWALIVFAAALDWLDMIDVGGVRVKHEIDQLLADEPPAVVTAKPSGVPMIPLNSATMA